MSGGIMLTRGDQAARAALRTQIRDDALGVTSWTIDPAFTWQTGTHLMTDGSVCYTAIGLAAGDVVTSIILPINTAGAGTSLSKVGLYDASLNRLALSADQGSAWNSTGKKVIALTSAYTVTSSGMYYLAVVAKTATTMPTLVRGTNNAISNAPIGSGPRPAFDQTGQTDLPSTGSTAAIATTVTICMGWV